MQNMLSESAVKHVEVAEKTKNLTWLDGDIDIGAIVAENDSVAIQVFESQMQSSTRFMSGKEAFANAQQKSSRSYYVIGKRSDSKTWRVADCFGDFSVEASASIVPASEMAESAAI